MNPNKPASDQGALFEEKVVHSGSTEPTTHNSEIRFEPVDGGVFPEPVPEPIKLDADRARDEAVHQAVVTDHRHKAQLGKHSPLERDGSYSGVRPGDILPGFGVVTQTNLQRAKQRARELDAERNSKG